MARKKLENTGTGINTRMIYEDEQPTISTSSTTDDPYLRMEVTGWYEINSHNFKAGPLINLPGAASPPANPEDGDVYYNTSDNIVYIYYSGSWHSIVSSSQGSFLLRSNNLSDVESASASRTNLGLGDIAVKNVDDVIKQTINSGNTTTAPSENAVYNALAGKASVTHHTQHESGGSDAITLPYCRLKRTSDLTSTTSDWTVFPWEQAEYNYGNPPMWDSSSPGRVTIRRSGIYLFNVQLLFSYVATEVYSGILLFKNGVPYALEWKRFTWEYAARCTWLYPLNSGDVIDICYYTGKIQRTIQASYSQCEVVGLFPRAT